MNSEEKKMIDIRDKKDCCGCNACADACGHEAIIFRTDTEGFWYPEVDKNKCVNCGLCEQTCPQLHALELKRNDFVQPECHAAIHKNIEIRFDSTSGGMFTALAENIYKVGGYVGGAVYNDDFSVRHFISNDKKDLLALRSSKYQQSDASGFYKSVRSLLRQGEKVLVCGTPCQMAALRAFLQKEYENLIIIDFICRGINSPKVHRKYLEYLEERFGSKVIYIKSKSKELGWRQLTSKIIFQNKKVLYDTRDSNYFTIGYLRTGVYCRPSCYECQFKGFPRLADITIADYWGAEYTVGRELDGDLGTSLVMLNSKKGVAFFESVKENINEKIIPFKSIIKGNLALVSSLSLLPGVDREAFYKDLSNMPFREVARKYIDIKEGIFTWRRKIKNVLRFLFEVKKASGLSLKTYYQNIKYNFFSKEVSNSILKGQYLLIYKHTVVDIQPWAKICLKGVLKLGTKKFKSSHLETRFLVETRAEVIIENNFEVSYGSDIEVFVDAKLHIGGKGGGNINLTIICGERISLGEYVMLGRNVTIRDNNGGHYIARRGYRDSRPVVIGQHAWLCEGCTVMAGAKIGDGAIVGAHALVAGNVPSFTMVAGNPAQIIDEGVYWKY